MKNKFLQINLETLGVLVILYISFFYFTPYAGKFLTINIHPLVIITIIQSLRYPQDLSIISLIYCTGFYCYGFYTLGYDISIIFISYKYSNVLLIMLLINILLGHEFAKNFLKKKLIQDEIYKKLGELKKIERNWENLKIIKSTLENRAITSGKTLKLIEGIECEIENVVAESGVESFIEIFNKNLVNKAVYIFKYNKKIQEITLLEKTRESEYFELLLSKKELNENFEKLLNLQGSIQIKDNENHYFLTVIKNKNNDIFFIGVEASHYEDLYQFKLFEVIAEKINETLFL